MKYEDLSFTVKYADGKELINDVTAVIVNPNNNKEPYVTFTDYTLDENNEFNTYYGKIITQDGESFLFKDLTPEEITYIKEQLSEEVTKYVNDTIQDNLEN